jgi:hypothetical protein
MNKQQQHFMVGATLGTEDRGDICIRDMAGNLLYRMTPTLKRPNEPLAEVMRVCAFQSSAVARRDNLEESVSPSTLAGRLLVQYAEVVQELHKQVMGLTVEHAQALNLVATLDRAKELSAAAGPVIAGLELLKA